MRMPTSHGEVSQCQDLACQELEFKKRERKWTPPKLNLRTCQESSLWACYESTRNGECCPHSCQEVREAIILRYYRDAIGIADSYYAHKMPRYSLASRDDLRQAALMGLCEAVDRFNPRVGTTFMQYACTRIRGSVFDCLRSLQDFPRIIAHIRRKYRIKIQWLTHQLNRMPTQADLREYLGEEAFEELSDPLFASGVFNQAQHTSNGSHDAREGAGLENLKDYRPKKQHRSHQRSLEHERVLTMCIKDDDVRFAVYAAYWLKWSLSKIAFYSDCSPSTVHNRIEKGKKIIQATLSSETLEAMFGQD